MKAQHYKMVDVGGKAVTRRRAVASGALRMSRKAFRLLENGGLPKGDPRPAAEVAGIMAAKNTPLTIPLCHPLPLEAVTVAFELDHKLPGLRASCTAVAEAKTGVEMEALAGVTAALLAVYDVVKQVEPALTIQDVRLDTKEGGKSGSWRHPELSADSCRHETVDKKKHLSLRAAVITVSDRCSRGLADDRSGPALAAGLEKLGFKAAEPVVIPDDRELIAKTIKKLAKTSDAVVLTGGTGLSPRDSGSIATAALSRSTAGQLGTCVVVALPGSTGGVRDGLTVLRDLLPHAIHIARGGDH
jgi:cyclic pyranopterin monophosphate synthase